LARTDSRAMTREPIDAWIATSNIWRGISSRRRSVIARPYWYARSRGTTDENASTGSPCSRMSTRTRSDCS
jgi:hypothetical protein